MDEETVVPENTLTVCNNQQATLVDTDVSGVKEIVTQPDIGIDITEQIRKQVEPMLKQLVKKFGLEGVDIDAECAKIEKLESNLSSRQRRVVIELGKMRKQEQNVMKSVAKAMLMKAGTLTEEMTEAEINNKVDAEVNTAEATTVEADTLIKASEAADKTNQVLDTAIEI